MAITSAEIIPYSLPFAQPYVTARGRLERREMVLLRLRDDDGLEGLGEAVPLSLRGGDPLNTVVGELQDWAERAVQGSAEAESAAPATAGTLSPPARCAVDTATLDLRARAGGVPAWKALGARSAEPVECNATLTAAEPAAVAAQAEGWAAAGFRTFKLKVGVPGDERQVEAVRVAVGDDARVRIDANGAWSVDEAVRKLGAMCEYGLELAEEPVHGLEDLARVRAAAGLRIAADESLTGPEGAAEAVALGSCDLATVKLSKVGGIPELLRIAGQVPTYLSSALDGPVGIAAAAHAAQALRETGGDAGVAHGLATQRLFSTTIAARGCEVRAGRLHLPDGPGLGVIIDEQALERHRLMS